MTFERPSVLLLTLAVIATPACAALTEPPSAHVGAAAAPHPAAAPAPTPPPAPVQPVPSGETVGASHILVAFTGAMRADPSITRTKDEARKKAEGILARAKKGEDFAKLADENSDDPSAKRNHGSLGKFTKEQMVKPFADAAFGLKPGEVSPIVETAFGYHVIKRTE